MTDRINNRILGFFENTMTQSNITNMSSVTTTAKPNTTPKTIITVLETNNAELEEILEEISNIEIYLTAIMLLIAAILLFKVFKSCKTAYKKTQREDYHETPKF